MSNNIKTKNLSLINDIKEKEFEGMVKIRYQQKDQKCKIKILKHGLDIKFEKPQRAVTPGQSAVIYKEDVCLGGGEIKEIS